MSLEWTPKTPRSSFIDDFGHKHYKRYVKYKDGATLYSMGTTKFCQLAKEAKAVYKIDKLCLVNLDIFDEYIESFRIQ